MNESQKAPDRSQTRFFSNGEGSGNQYSQLVAALAPVVEFVRHSLLAGDRVSEVVRVLHRQGYAGMFAFICIFAEATDAGIGELKGFGRWWNDESGPTDDDAVDAYAMELKLHQRVTGS